MRERISSTEPCNAEKAQVQSRSSRPLLSWMEGGGMDGACS
jgi:hypothetical protein